MEPDPFTGSQGRALEQRIMDLERRVSTMQDQIQDEYLKELEERLEYLEKAKHQ